MWQERSAYLTVPIFLIACFVSLSCSTGKARRSADASTPGTCDAVTCTGHGRCEATSGRATCICDPGYHTDGLECLSDGDPCDGITCSGRGTCVVDGPRASCDCASGYHAEGLECVRNMSCTDRDGDDHGVGCDAGPDCDDTNADIWDGCPQVFRVGVNDTYWISENIFSSGTNWSEPLLEHLASVPYSAFRFMNWNGNGGQIAGGPDGSWSTRVPRGDIVEDRISYEDQIALANEAHIDLWICVSARTDEHPDHWSNLAQLVFDTLDPSLKLYIEWSNESWNYGGAYSGPYASERGAALGLAGDYTEQGSRYTAYVGVRLWEAFEAVFGADSPRLVTVLSGQSGNAWLTQIHLSVLDDPALNPRGTMPDAYGVAPYFYGSTIEELQMSLRDIGTEMANVREVLPAGVELITYEGGQSDWSAALTTNNDPRMYDLYYSYLDILSEHTDLFMAYNLDQAWDDGGAWGAVNNDFSHDSHKLRAIRDWLAAH